MKFFHTQYGIHSETAVIAESGEQVGVIAHAMMETPAFRVNNRFRGSLSAEDLDMIAARVRAEDERWQMRHQGAPQFIEVPVTEECLSIQLDRSQAMIAAKLVRVIATGERHYEIRNVTLEALEAMAARDPHFFFDLFKTNGKIREPMPEDRLPRWREGEDVILGEKRAK